MSQLSPPEIKQMSISDRLALIETIWDTIVEEGQPLPLTPAQRAELESRLKDGPKEGILWEDLLKRVRDKL